MGLKSTELPAASPTVARTLAEAIRSDIISGVLYPGAHLHIRNLCTSYQCSLIPMREALSRLVSTGFVVSKARHGFFVAGVSQSELSDITETRIYVECEALRLSIERGSLAWEERLVGIHHRLSRMPIYAEGRGGFAAEWEATHSAFHEALIAGCGSKTLQDICGELRDKTARYRQLSTSGAKGHSGETAGNEEPYGWDRDLVAEHSRLLEATLARDAGRATHLLAAHYRQTAELVLTWSRNL